MKPLANVICRGQRKKIAVFSFGNLIAQSTARVSHFLYKTLCVKLAKRWECLEGKQDLPLSGRSADL